MSRRDRWTVATIVVLAAIVRAPGLFTDFWSDEIWSWSIAGQLHSISDLLLATPARIDNNHPLNTLWLYLCGQQAAVWLYRMPALLAGIGTVIVAVHITSRRGTTAAVTAAVVIGFSYPMVFYSTEARGYSLAVFFGFAAFDALELALLNGESLASLAFGVAASLGFLAHLTFLHVYAGAFVWSSVVILRGEDAKTRRGEESREEEKIKSGQPADKSPVFFASSVAPSRLRALSRLHLLPAVTACGLSITFIKHMIIGGAPPTNPIHTLLWTLSLPLGGPDGVLGSAVAASLAILLFILSLLLIPWPRREWIFFFVAVVVSPVLTTVRECGFADHPQPLFVRYFLVCVSLLLLAICPLVAWLWDSRPTRPVVVAAGIVFLAGNGLHLTRFARVGRGSVSAAVMRIANASPVGPIELASDNIPRTQMPANFYAGRLQPSRSVVVENRPLPWLVLNRAGENGQSHLRFDGADYTLAGSYPSGRLSGWTWLVYRRDSL